MSAVALTTADIFGEIESLKAEQERLDPERLKALEREAYGLAQAQETERTRVRLTLAEVASRLATEQEATLDAMIEYGTCREHLTETRAQYASLMQRARKLGVANLQELLIPTVAERAVRSDRDGIGWRTRTHLQDFKRKTRGSW